MEEEALARAEAELIDWGILERAPELAPTKRFRGAMMRAAAKLQQEEVAGARRPGHAVENTVTLALAEYPLPPGATITRAHTMLVVALQIASLPESVRALLDTA